MPLTLARVPRYDCEESPHVVGIARVQEPPLVFRTAATTAAMICPMVQGRCRVDRTSSKRRSSGRLTVNVPPPFRARATCDAHWLLPCACSARGEIREVSHTYERAYGNPRGQWWVVRWRLMQPGRFPAVSATHCASNGWARRSRDSRRTRNARFFGDLGVE